MPDDIRGLAQTMAVRGAVAVTIRAPLDGERTQRHAAWRIPLDHPETARLDKLHAEGFLDARLYANACAVWRLYDAAGLGRSEGIATWLRTCRTTGEGRIDEPTAEDELRYLIRNGVDFEAVLMLVRGDPMAAYMFSRAVRGLDKLDALAARWDGEMWRDE